MYFSGPLLPVNSFQKDCMAQYWTAHWVSADRAETAETLSRRIRYKSRNKENPDHLFPHADIKCTVNDVILSCYLAAARRN